MTFADALTWIRLMLIPLFVYAFVAGLDAIALIIFSVASATDIIDGTVARIIDKRNSEYGFMLDPVADKMLMGSAFGCLAAVGVLPLWFFFLVLARDVIILYGFFYLTSIRASVEKKPLITSKIGTLFQIVTGVMGLVAWWKPGTMMGETPVVSAVVIPMWVTVALIVISGVQYVFLGVGLLRAHRAKNS